MAAEESEQDTDETYLDVIAHNSSSETVGWMSAEMSPTTYVLINVIASHKHSVVR